MAKLYVLSEKGERESYDIPGESVSIGRSPDNDIQINDKYASRKHFKLERRGDKYFIRDLKSKNGTFVNGKQINPGSEHQVEEGITIVVGMSVVCLGEGSCEDVFAFLDSIGGPKEFTDSDTIVSKNRVMTPKKNRELIEKVSEILLGPMGMKEISEKMLDYIFDVFKRIDRGFILLIDPKSRKVSEVTSRSKKNIDKTDTKYSKKLVAKVIRTGKPVMMSDTHAEKDDDLSGTLRILHVRSVICVPLVASSKPVGAIYVDSITQPYGFRKDDLSLFTAMSSRLALALETASIESKKGRD